MNKLFKTNDIELPEIINAMGDAIWVSNEQYNLVACNDVFSKWIDIDLEDLIGQNIFDIYPSFKNSVFYEASLKTLTTGKEDTKIGYSNRINKWLVIRMCKINDYIVWYAHELNHSPDKLAHSSNYDSLTSLYNRFSFESHLSDLHNVGNNFGLVLIDINKFRQVNESLGFHFGDMCLMETAARFKEFLNVNIDNNIHHIYRFGADQFAITINKDKEHCIHIIQGILNLFKEPYKINKEEFTLTASVGFLYLTNFDCDTTDIISNAEFVLKKAKKLNHSYVEYNEKLLRNTTKMFLAKQLKQALSNNELELYYQPQIDSLNHKVCGAEALIRWNHPTQGFLPPGQFLAVAEEYNMIQDIDRFVIKKVMSDILLFLKEGISIPISINFSAKTICNLDTITFLDECINIYKIDPSLLLIEITENSLMEDLEKSQEVLKQLSNRHIQLAIDDFGTGYSSMGYLVRYPTNFLKIDREFITEINTSNTLQIMTGNLIKLGHSLCMTVVAEGVETEEELNMLKQYNCDIIQGYFFSKPISLPNFIRFVHTQGCSDLKKITQ